MGWHGDGLQRLHDDMGSGSLYYGKVLQRLGRNSIGARMSYPNCEAMVMVAKHVSQSAADHIGKKEERVVEALIVADCCRKSKEFELAKKILSLIPEEMLSDERKKKKKVAIETLNSAQDTSPLEDDYPIIRMQPPTHVNPPPLVVQGINFAAAQARWMLSGCPVRTRAEIEQIVKVCQSCPNFENNACNKCGCACTAHQTILNKIYLKTENCPEGKW